MDERQAELFRYYTEQYKDATDSEYKAHYRQMIQLMREGRTAADGKAIRLTAQMLDWLYVSYKLMRDAQSSRGRKGGQASSEAKAEAARRNGAKGGRPLKTIEDE